MASGNWRCPDASLVRKERFAGAEIPVMAAFAPDLAFEVHSPSDKPSEIQSKRKDYRPSGVIQVWIDPQKRLVELVYPDRPLEYFQEDQPSSSPVSLTSRLTSRTCLPSEPYRFSARSLSHAMTLESRRRVTGFLSGR